MGHTNTLNWFETPHDIAEIDKQNWQIQIALQVATSTATTTPTDAAIANVIWQSQGAPVGSVVSWHPDYALAWSPRLPEVGGVVRILGGWQPCKDGEVWDIDNTGNWVASKGVGTDGWLTVGNVDYLYQGTSGLHIVIGVKNAISGRWEAIFIDTAQLSPHNGSKYQPQQNAIWWLQTGSHTGEVFSETAESFGGLDFARAQQYEWWTTYATLDKKWSNSPSSPSQTLLAPPQSAAIPNFMNSDEIVLYDFAASFQFTIAVSVPQRSGLINYVTNLLSQTFTAVEVRFPTDIGNEFSITYGPPKSALPGSMEMLGFASGSNREDPFENALRSALRRGLLPQGETWTRKSPLEASRPEGPHSVPA